VKLLVVLLALLLLVWLLFGSSRRRTRDARRDSPSKPAPGPAAKIEDMVVCAHCGVPAREPGAARAGAQLLQCGTSRRRAARAMNLR